MMANSAFQAADILLPKPEAMSEVWAVCACDQYTGEPAYWEETARLVGDRPSTLQMILPEVYLNQPDVTERITNIQRTMKKYLQEQLFTVYKQAMIYVERLQSDGKLRLGLLGAVDLEQYDYRKGSVSPIRATEATVAERIPPRMRIRKDAPLELPHIMILLDDIQNTVIEPLEKQKDKLKKLYDTPLMQGGGAIKGYLVPQEEQQRILNALEALGLPERFPENTAPLVYAMGDGNHSLATAKACYEAWKQEHPHENTRNCPMRYALVELVNLHSPALEFEAIHRILTEIDTEKLLSDMTVALDLRRDEPAAQAMMLLHSGKKEKFFIHQVSSNLTVGTVQSFLDKWLSQNGGKIDYIHGAEVVEELAKTENSMGILLPDMQKSELFPTVMRDGALPRKTFSMGHAQDKRYYMECRRILAE